MGICSHRFVVFLSPHLVGRLFCGMMSPSARLSGEDRGAAVVVDGDQGSGGTLLHQLCHHHKAHVLPVLAGGVGVLIGAGGQGEDFVGGGHRHVEIQEGTVSCLVDDLLGKGGLDIGEHLAVHLCSPGPRRPPMWSPARR